MWMRSAVWLTASETIVNNYANIKKISQKHSHLLRKYDIIVVPIRCGDFLYAGNVCVRNEKMIFRQQTAYHVPDMMRVRKPRLDFAQRAVMKWATMEEYDRVLDVDCGEGALLSALDETYRVSLCGLCSNVRLARAAREDFPGADIVYAKPMDIPFRSESFDEVFITRNTGRNCAEVSLNEILRVLRPGGQVLIAARMLTPLFADSEPEMDKRSIMRALQSAGFSDVSWRRCGLCGVIIGWKNRMPR